MFLRPQQILSLRAAADLDRREQVSSLLLPLLSNTRFSLDEVFW